MTPGPDRPGSGPPDARPRISVLAVGGTIAMTGDEGRGVQPSLDADALLDAVPAIGEIARLQARSVARVPGPHVDLALVDQLAACIEAERHGGADGIVVTHGTDTLEETAFALELMLGEGAPVAVTGAMRTPDAPGADGPANLLHATRFVGSPAAADSGVTVVFDGGVCAARHVTKAHTHSVSAFDPGPVLVARVTERRVTRLASLPPLPGIGWRTGTAPAPVALFTAALGDDGRLLDHLVDAGYAGVVVAGMGGGHVYPGMATRIGELTQRIPVVIASRTGAGSTLAETYGYDGGEAHLARLGAIRAGWLVPLKARVALSLLLAAGHDERSVRQFFAAVDGG